MIKNSRIGAKKVRARKVANLAAYSRQFTVRNVKKTMPDKHEYKLIYDNISNAITCPFTGHKFVPTNPHPIPSQKFGFTITGYEWVEPKGKLWEHKKYPQPKNLRKKYKKKYYEKGTHTIRKIIEHPSDFPVYICKKMNHVEYMEKLVEHKLAKWERKNPAPADMFVKDVEKWKQERETAKERFRDFVVSIYDKLPLIGRFKNKTTDVSAEYIEEKVAELKDINGDGHRVNEVTEKSPLLKKAKKITNQVKAKRKNLVATNLKDHKRTRGRIILPDSELQKAA